MFLIQEISKLRDGLIKKTVLIIQVRFKLKYNIKFGFEMHDSASFICVERGECRGFIYNCRRNLNLERWWQSLRVGFRIIKLDILRRRIKSTVSTRLLYSIWGDFYEITVLQAVISFIEFFVIHDWIHGIECICVYIIYCIS